MAILDNAINSHLYNASSEKNIELTTILAYPRRYKITTIIITIKTVFQGGNAINTKEISLAALYIYSYGYKNLIEHVKVNKCRTLYILFIQLHYLSIQGPVVRN